MSFQLIDDILENAAPLVVIIDDEFTSRTILERIVRNVRNDILVKAFSDPIEALAWVRVNQPDLIMVDYMMAGMTGLEAIQQMRQTLSLEGVPIVVVTSIEEREIRHKVLESGATDFITKPIDPYECMVRCRNMLSLRMQQKVILNRAQFLEQRITEATERVRLREQETLFRLAKAGEYRDEDTGNHIIRMAKYSRVIAEKIGLPQDQCDLIEASAPMHDIGKIGIPDHILLKPGRLTAEELVIMRTHAVVGFRILQDSPSKYLKLGATIALSHHEKYDGSGYPYNLKGEEIPLEARIVALADVYDALTSNRPYKRAWTIEAAVEYVTSNRGSHFDPQCVDAFISQLSVITQIQQQLLDLPEPTSESAEA